MDQHMVKELRAEANHVFFGGLINWRLPIGGKKFYSRGREPRYTDHDLVRCQTDFDR